jgi:predicted membrane channel-forming protein YqfA (hemolysin III family)
MKNKLVVLSGLGLIMAPFLAFAQSITGNGSCAAQAAGTLGYILCIAGNILNTLIPILIVLGVVYFIWGVLQYVISADEEAKKKGKDHMIWGIIGLVVIVALWGLVSVLTTTFGLNSGSVNVNAPTINIQ